ncbi:MAG: LrgB family protein [Lachnospiraceae bacterium]|jgi:putative effector of murein hydrolase|nr:LrgB family protein [Lachnospiraceae bacterium]
MGNVSDIVALSATFGVVISIIGYGLGVLIRNKTGIGIFNPLLISIIFVMVILSVFHIGYRDYNSSAKYLSYLLTPATVSLAVPLYLHIDRLKRNWVGIAVGLISGSITSMGSVLVMSVLFGLSHKQYVTLLPKSITTAIGMGISDELGGLVTISVAVIIITGILGNVLAVTICRLFRITDPVAKGLAIGAAAHAIGTSKAMEMGDIEGAMASLAIVVNGLITVIGASFFAMLY